MVQEQHQNLEKQIEKQMGCMAGFLQIFDRSQILTGKRFYSTKRLPPSNIIDSSSELEKVVVEHHQPTRTLPSPDNLKHQHQQQLNSPVTEPRSPLPESSPKLPLPLQVFELKEGNKSSWKFCKEAPRLSLDSRATFDAVKGNLKPKEIRTNAAILSSSSSLNKNGVAEETDDDHNKQHRSPSVIARLMGLEKLPEWEGEPEQPKKPELRRSASESRANRDLHQYRFIDGVNFQLKQSQQQQCNFTPVKDQTVKNRAVMDPKEYRNAVRNVRAEPAARGATKSLGQKKSFYDTADFFPEPKQTASIYGEIEKRLKMRGIDEPAKDLETLKHILEALQLKGLLHTKKPSNQNRNFVYDGRSFEEESPIVVMKPARSVSPSTPINRQGRFSNGYNSPPPPSSYRSSPIRRDSNTMPAAMSPRRDRPEVEHNGRSQNRCDNRNSISPTRSESSSLKSPSRRGPLSVETQRRGSNINNSRVSPVQSPRVNSRKTTPDQFSNRSPRNRKQTAVVGGEDESSSFSDSISSSSQTDTERSKMEDYKEGRNLLERCDKLLHSIAEMTTTTTSELQPSPVSVLDSSFYKEESSPSPVMKRSVDFKDQLAEFEDDDLWSPAVSPIQLIKSVENSEDCDFIYISDILKAFNYLPEDSDVFLLLEKQQYLKGKDSSKVSRLQRKLIFDTIQEILNRKRRFSSWKASICVNSSREGTTLQQIWSEFRIIRERESSDDLLEVICGMLKKDLAGDALNGWRDCQIEMSDAVLDIERLIFKDLIGETIRDLAVFDGKCNQATLPRRKLVF
ncbi:protein LONGIFOLIA 1 isoform X2 [Mercurialis annua]|uniref:protein LONGIFOLIA 1 isoform X2 n=1 Tax=Mercurialis annua TaxID=3986 RepID=UPI00215F11AE|nr:protein LONGIFOLIA 1 isoform X2 [Mercurialis annua]